MTYVTLAVTDLDRLCHALLLAKADYCSDAVQRCNGIYWDQAKLNLEALQELYDQLDQALVNEVQEG